MNRQQIVNQIIPHLHPAKIHGEAFASANIALIKYWGKRDIELNCPVTDSLSLSLGPKGTYTKITAQPGAMQDVVFLNNQLVATTESFHQRLSQYLDLFRPDPSFHFRVETHSTVPVAAGLASSASGFAALVLALNQFFDWQCDKTTLSILARMGSGSASRSLWPGFVHWHRGEREDGLDSYAEPLPHQWPQLRLAILTKMEQPKKVSSRNGMIHCQETSPFYELWPACVQRDLDTVYTALVSQDFDLLGQTAEANAIAMHALARTARPAIEYSEIATFETIARVRQCREDGLRIYFTQDAGPHIKILFLAQDEPSLRDAFPTCEVIDPFDNRGLNAETNRNSLNDTTPGI